MSASAEHLDDTLEVPPGSPTQEDHESPEDLALTPDHSPTLDRGSAGDNSWPGPTSANVDADTSAGRGTDDDADQQPSVPYIKTLEAIYRAVDSLASSPVVTSVDSADDTAAAAEREHDGFYCCNYNCNGNCKRSCNCNHTNNNHGTDYYDDDDDNFFDIGDVQDLCPACATPYARAVDSVPFRTGLRLLYNDPWKQTWALGERYVLTEMTTTTDSWEGGGGGGGDSQPGGPEVALAEATRMLRETTQVPVPAVVAAWKEEGEEGREGGRGRGRGRGRDRSGGGSDGAGGDKKKVITITEKAPGSRLYDVWWELTPEDRERVAMQVAGYAEQWRRNYADAIASVSGYPIVRGYETLLGYGRGRGGGGGGGDDGGVVPGGARRERERGFPHCRSDIEFWGAIEERLRSGRRGAAGADPKKVVDEETIRLLREYMPESYPCVLTHGDLSARNILVEIDREGNGNGNGGVGIGGPHGAGVRVSAILGFENAASLPVWAEAVCARFCYCREDEQWKALLSKYLRQDPAALDWWYLWRAVRGDDDAGENEARMMGPKAYEARVRALAERCRRWPKPSPERRAFNTARVEPGARQVPRREPAAAVGGEDDEKPGTVRVPVQPVPDDETQDEPASLDEHRMEREAVDLGPDPSPSPSARGSVFNPDPIPSPVPEDDENGDDADDGSIGGDTPTNGIESTDLMVRNVPENPLYESDEGSLERQRVDERQDGEEERQRDEKEEERKTILRDKRTTWHTSRATEGSMSLNDFLGPSSAATAGVDTSARPHSLGCLEDTSPHGPALAADTMVDLVGQHFRGRPRQRNSARETQPRSSGSNSRRTPMRSFTQRTLQPFALRPSARGRPQSLPATSAISLADMERLRNIGGDGGGGDEGEGAHRAVAAGGALPESGSEPVPVDADEGGLGRGEGGLLLLPTIREHPATPRRPTQQLLAGGRGGRARPASLYGALHAWGQKSSSRPTGGGGGGGGGGAHKRSRSEMLFNSSSRRRRGAAVFGGPEDPCPSDAERRVPSLDPPPDSSCRSTSISWDSPARSRSHG